MTSTDRPYKRSAKECSKLDVSAAEGERQCLPTISNSSRAAQCSGASTSGGDTANPQVVKAGIRKPDAQEILHDLPHHEFLKFLDEATPEQLVVIAEHSSVSKKSKNASAHLVNEPGTTSLYSSAVWWESRRSAYNLLLLIAGSP